MKKENNVIDTLDFEISNQELGGKSATGYGTAFAMTIQGRCGRLFTASYECSSPNVRCG